MKEHRTMTLQRDYESMLCKYGKQKNPEYCLYKLKGNVHIMMDHYGLMDYVWLPVHTVVREETDQSAAKGGFMMTVALLE